MTAGCKDQLHPSESEQFGARAHCETTAHLISAGQPEYVDTMPSSSLWNKIRAPSHLAEWKSTQRAFFMTRLRTAKNSDGDNSTATVPSPLKNTHTKRRLNWAIIKSISVCEKWHSCNAVFHSEFDRAGGKKVIKKPQNWFECLVCLKVHELERAKASFKLTFKVTTRRWIFKARQTSKTMFW